MNHSLGTPSRRLLRDERTWLALYVVIASVATAVCVIKVCNNFLIFRAAFDHLVAGVDMYVHHPREHWDLYKYSPTFALLFAPFRAIPYAPALLAWNLLNVVLIYVALRMALEPRQRLAAIALTGFGLITTLDGTQSNGLLAALIVMTFVAFERTRLVAAATAISLGTLVKLFPAAALALAIPRSDRWRFFAIFAAVLATLVALPLVVTTPATLLAQYESWYAMGAVDALDRGASVMRLLHDIFGYDGPNWPVQLAGTVLLFLPMVRGEWGDATHRRLFLASLLVYAVIFNHKAEQPSYVIAVVGMAIWFAVSQRTPVRVALTAAFFISTVPILLAVAIPSLPGGTRVPLGLAAATSTLAWLAMQGQLLDLLPSTRAARAALEPREIQPAE